MEYIFKLVDGGITNINDYTEHYDGCNTCGFGAFNCTTVTFYLDYFTLTLTFKYENSTVSNLLKSIGKHIDDIKLMTEEEFCKNAETFLNADKSSCICIDDSYYYN